MLSRKNSLAVFWCILGLEVPAIAAAILTDNFTLCGFLAGGLMLVLLIFCGVQIYLMRHRTTPRKLCKKTLYTFISSFITFLICLAFFREDRSYPQLILHALIFALCMSIFRTWEDLLPKKQ